MSLWRVLGNLISNLLIRRRTPLRPTDRGLFDPFVPITSLNQLDNEYQADYSLTEQKEVFSEEEPVVPGFWVFKFLIILVTVVIGFRLIGLQITQGRENFSLAEGNRLEAKPTPAPRGLIYDRHGTALVRNEPSFSAVLKSAEVPQKEEERNHYLQRLAAALNRPETELRGLVVPNLNKSTVVLEDSLTRDRALSLELRLQGLKGVELEKVPNRHYSELASLGHLIGYIGKATVEDLKERPNLLNTALVGKAGIERSYDVQLQGTPGIETVETDSLGRTVRLIGSTLPVSGKSLILGLDAQVQAATAQALKEAIEKNNATSGAAVALDVRTGEVIAMVSFPSFDNNLFSTSIDPQKRKEILSDPGAPLINRAIAGQYPSGSTIKPFVAAAALQERTISSDTILDTSEGKITVGQNTFSDWKVHGRTNVSQAIAESNNIFFFALGGGYKQIPGLGIEKLKGYFERFGFGQETGIDLGEGAEAKGLVPDPAWKKRVKNENWYLGDTYNTSIGQGNLLVTPLQLVRATAAIANGGKLIEPRLVRSIVASNGVSQDLPAKTIKEALVEASVLDAVRAGMRQAVVSGSARSFASLPVEVAAKTGTAQTSKSKDKTHSWFTCFAPFNNPELAVSVIVEGGGEGFAVAAPVAKNTLEQYFKLPLTPIVPATPAVEVAAE